MPLTLDSVGSVSERGGKIIKRVTLKMFGVEIDGENKLILKRLIVTLKKILFFKNY